MASQWFYQAKGQQWGPVLSAELRRLADAGTVTPHTLVRAAEMADVRWVRAAKVQGLLFQQSDEPPVLDSDHIIAEAKAPRTYHPHVLAMAERIVNELSPAERRTVAVLALADRIVDWYDTEADAARARIKARRLGGQLF